MGNMNSITREDFDDILKGTKFSMDEIQNLYKVFKKEFPSGKITRYKFITSYSKWFANKEEAQDFTDHLFRTYDENGDGEICFKEFLTSVSVASKGNAEEKLRWAFKMYDIDQSGEISYDELIEILTCLYKAKGRDDAKRKAISAARQIMKLDEDRNGQLSMKEFVSGAMKDPTMFDLLRGKVKS